MFKKSILFLSLMVVSSTSAFASYVFNNTFYVRGDLMGAKFFNTRYYDSETNWKIKSKEILVLDFGLGYNFFSGLRSELVFTHIFPVNYSRPIGAKNIEAIGNSIMLRAAYDIYDFELFKVFVGGGVGLSRLKTKVKNDWVYRNNGVITGIIPKPSSKPKYNFALNALAGISFDLGPANVIELCYLYADYGKTAGLKVAPHVGKFAMRSHNIFLGFRYEF